MQLLRDGVVEPVNAATGSGGNGHLGGQAEDLRRDGGPHAKGLGHLRMLPERRRTGIARGRLHHPEGRGVDRRQAEAESAKRGPSRLHQPRAQTSRTWHRVSSGSWPSPEGQAGVWSAIRGPPARGEQGHQDIPCHQAYPEPAVRGQLPLQVKSDPGVVGRSVWEASVAGSVTQRVLGMPVQSPQECTTRGAERWPCPPRGDADAHHAPSMPWHEARPCACEAVRESHLCVTLPTIVASHRVV